MTSKPFPSVRTALVAELLVSSVSMMDLTYSIRVPILGNYYKQKLIQAYLLRLTREKTRYYKVCKDIL